MDMLSKVLCEKRCVSTLISRLDWLPGIHEHQQHRGRHLWQQATRTGILWESKRRIQDSKGSFNQMVLTVFIDIRQQEISSCPLERVTFSPYLLDFRDCKGNAAKKSRGETWPLCIPQQSFPSSSSANVLLIWVNTEKLVEPVPVPSITVISSTCPGASLNKNPEQISPLWSGVRWEQNQISNYTPEPPTFRSAFPGFRGSPSPSPVQTRMLQGMVRW
ncbi:uncharacterized protein [Chiloscyllium punctatum]|uniref:uncharacterized protein isoform X2 n=1 Tax=Chiloscyllium punctatum TaxID=137246 RepID=UPI003B642575